MNKLVFPLAFCGFNLVLPALAAPLDAFLSANQNTTPGKVQLEAGYDLVNSTVDVLKIRDTDSNYAGTNVGDYQGVHVRAGVAVTPKIWVDGALWQRRLDYRSDVLSINSWQLGGQYKLREGSAVYDPSIAVRVSAWGNSAGDLQKTSPTTVSGVTLNTVNVSNPQDTQYQLDLIFSTKLTANTELSAFVGTGTSKVSLNSVSGTTTRDGCHYNLAFTPNALVGSLAQPCNASVVVDRFSIANSVAGIDINNEAKYNASFYQAGLMLKWTQQDWQVRGGYQYQTFSRNQIDSTIQSRGGTAYESNHILVGDVMYRLFSNTAIFLRGQYMSNQFIGEIPFAYNTLTASRFNKRYGYLSTGLVMAF